MSLKKERIAIFDMDYTILPYDSLIPFAGFIVRKNPWRIFYLAIFIPACALYPLGLFGRGGLKRAFLSVLWRMKMETLDALCKEFAQTKMKPILYNEVLLEARDLKKKGYTLILNSASIESYVKYIGEAAGFDSVIGTRLKHYDRMPLFPEIIGKNNRGIEKILRMKDVVGEKEISQIESNIAKLEKDTGAYQPGIRLSNSIAYSDSSADLPILRICESAVLVHPSERLEAEGREKGWRVLKPGRPYSGKIGKYVRLILCLIGIVRLTDL